MTHDESNVKTKYARFSLDGQGVFIDPRKVSAISPCGDYGSFTMVIVSGKELIVDQHSDRVHAILMEVER